jgi:internalin A
LSGLTSLDVSYNGIGEGGARELARLTGLTSLFVSYNGIGEGGARELARLTSLEYLNLFNTSFFDCSPATSSLSAWRSLSTLVANELLAAPPELGSQYSGENVLPGIRAWQQDLLDGEAPNTSLKVFLLGNGRVGKTQIRRRLFGRSFDPSVSSTHGIELEELPLAPATADRPAIDAKLWDFGGQSIYTGTHGLFLDERAIYVIAWNPRYENTEEVEQDGIPMRNRPLTYWLQYVRSIAGSNAPIIVTQTQCEEEHARAAVPLPAQHGFERLVTTYCSAVEPDGMERLRLELKSAARYQIERYGKVLLPQKWCIVAAKLEVLKPQRTISRADFEELCKTGYKTAVPSVVLDYLHRSGQVFYRQGAFDGQVVLDLNWALAGVYAVLDRDKVLPLIRLQGGRFSAQLLAETAWRQYPAADHEVFLSIMQQCQICFPVGNGIYVAPEALVGEASVRDQIEQMWRGAPPTAVASLQYEFLHEGVLRAILCALGDKAGEHAVYWAFGIAFYDQATKSVVRIRSEYRDETRAEPGGTIAVEASGPQAPVLVAALIRSIQRINIGAGPEVSWTVGASGEGTPERPREDKVEALFAGVTPAPAPAREDDPYPVYVSYKWGESDAIVDEFERKLPAGYKSMRDIHNLRPGDRISRFLQEIGRADCVLVVISEAYLRSNYCMRELLHLHEASQGLAEQFLGKVVPLVSGDLKLDSAEVRVTHVRFWEEEARRLKKALAWVDRFSLGEADRAELILAESVSRSVSSVLAWVADTLMPRGADGIDGAIDLIRRRKPR